MNKNRLETFCDGVIAIIITIMVLELKVPHTTEWASLKPVLPVFFSYLMSFVYLAIYWGNHHHLMHAITKVTSGIIWGNLNLLFWLSLIPFATAWMGENHFATNTVALYSVSLLMPALAYYILQSLVLKHNLHPEEFEMAHRKQNRKGQISLACYILSIVFSFISTIISGVFIVGVALMWIIPDKNIERVAGNNGLKKQ